MTSTFIPDIIFYRWNRTMFKQGSPLEKILAVTQYSNLFNIVLYISFLILFFKAQAGACRNLHTLKRYKADMWQHQWATRNQLTLGVQLQLEFIEPQFANCLCRGWRAYPLITNKVCKLTPRTNCDELADVYTILVYMTSFDCI